MKQYETMYILKADMEDAARDALIEELHGIITSHGGTIDNVDLWGVKEFAYEINFMNKGYYVVTTYSVEVDGLNEFQRLMGINNNVIRSLTINCDEKKGK